jgi:probable phosphoglycerate mutase
MVLVTTTIPSCSSLLLHYSKTRYVVVRCTSRSIVQEIDEKSENVFPPLKTAKRVVLVRHGQSTWNAEGRIQGSSDFSVLTKKGESQAETSRQMLFDDNFDACFSRSVYLSIYLSIYLSVYIWENE